MVSAKFKFFEFRGLLCQKIKSNQNIGQTLAEGRSRISKIGILVRMDRDE